MSPIIVASIIGIGYIKLLWIINMAWDKKGPTLMKKGIDPNSKRKKENRHQIVVVKLSNKYHLFIQ